MKTFRKLLILSFVSLAIASCSKKDDDGGDNNNVEVGTLTAKVNGANFSGSVVAIATETTVAGTTIIRLQASDASGKAIVILINAYTGENTYEISDANTSVNTASYTETNINNPASSPSWVAPFNSSGKVGEVTISEKTATTIKGTFNFEGKEQNGTSMKSITDGKFNLEFQ